MSLEFHGGGAFADFPFVQYPLGLGRQRAPATETAAAAAAAAAAASRASTGVYASASSSAKPVAGRPHLMRAGAALPPQNVGSSSSSRPVELASTVPLSSHALALVSVQPAQQSAVTVASHTAATPTLSSSGRPAETASETTARTARALQDAVAAARQTTEVFDSHSLVVQRRQRAALNQRNDQTRALTISAGGLGDGGAATADPGPIVRSPTKEKKSQFTDALLLRSGSTAAASAQRSGGSSGTGALAPSTASSSAMMVAVAEEAAHGGGGTASSRKVVVPFCVSSWQNRKKLIVPVEQRLAQLQDDRHHADGGMGDAVMDLAVAMQQASKEVAAELEAKERARAEEEERRQAALEAAEAEKARQLLEQKAAELAAHAQRKETREQRMARIQLERELREQERGAKQQQRLRERAAARLNITVEDLEADEHLLRTVEEAAVYAGSGGAERASSLADPTAAPRAGLKQEPRAGGEEIGDDDGDGTVGGHTKPAVRGGVFASAVISNEGVQREMKALADVEQQQQQQPQQHHDGIRLRDEDDDASAGDDDEDDGGSFQLQKLVKKKRRL
ncbi:SKIP/SNW domain containing protein [Novymonas esmeraldas]|uniref:SKIP/SNW domain containing protein n=1 Tax=Novymonas esmeraldas TaxID=1808958 RepID=A0AAW0ETK7_9TRYP